MIARLRDLLANPLFWLWYHGLWAVTWLVLFPPGMLWWRDSVPFLMFVSLQTALTGALAEVGAVLSALKVEQSRDRGGDGSSPPRS